MSNDEYAEELNPKQQLKNKNNFQKFALIHKDGSKVERIILSVPNIEKREEIICSHFLSRYVRFFIGKRTGIKIISRDEPWDFEIELSNGEELTMEITSIADQPDLFKKFKYQERLLKCSSEPKIEFHELLKMNYNFPDKKIDNLIEDYENQDIAKNALVQNPYYLKNFIFQSNFEEKVDSLDKLLKSSINKKVNKKHKGKQDLILIIDNRTVTFTLEDLYHHFETLDDYFKKLPFKEVWFYTGYYSDDDGNNAEYSLSPLKISDKKFNIVKEELS